MSYAPEVADLERELEAAEGRAAEFQRECDALNEQLRAPIPMILLCPLCAARHIDRGEFATKHHHTHACQACGFVWRPAIVATVGVEFLPGFKDP